MTDNQINKLPKNWTLKTLGEVCETTSGGTPSRTNFNFYTGSICWVKSGELNSGIITETEEHITDEALKKSSAKLFPVNTLLIALYGSTVGKLATLGIEAATNQAVCAVFPKEQLTQRFLYHFLFFKRPQLLEDRAGGAQPNISQSILRELQIPLPPLPEQQKIVQKIESLFTELETGTKALKTALTQLKIYRQAVLNHFLTNDSWKMVKLGDVCDRIFDGPFGSNLKSSDYTSSGVQVVRLENIGFMEFFEEKETFVSEDKYQSLIKHEVFKGDIIFSSFIGDYIRTTILPNLKYKAIAKADCFCVRPKEKFIDKQFLTFVLSSIRTQKILVLAVHGATRPRINTTQLKTFSLPLPSLETQTQIVSEIEKRMAGADALEASLKAQLVNAENLRQSILKRAFEGKLV